MNTMPDQESGISFCHLTEAQMQEMSVRIYHQHPWYVNLDSFCDQITHPLDKDAYLFRHQGEAFLVLFIENQGVLFRVRLGKEAEAICGMYPYLLPKDSLRESILQVMTMREMASPVSMRQVQPE